MYRIRIFYEFSYCNRIIYCNRICAPEFFMEHKNVCFSAAGGDPPVKRHDYAVMTFEVHYVE